MNKPVLVPLDGSDLAERALPYAATLARASDRPLLLLHVLTPTPPRGGELVHEDAARAQLNAVAERLRTDGLVVESVVSSTLRGRVAAGHHRRRTAAWLRVDRHVYPWPWRARSLALRQRCRRGNCAMARYHSSWSQ